jgi:hypothetical protein
LADIFISYTSSDGDWAFWIGQELEKLGHVAHIHEWEIDAGGNIPAWMQERQDKADHTLCIISSAYLSRPYSSWELQAAQWAAASDRPNFMLPVFVEECRAPTMVAPFKRCDLFGLTENEARERLRAYLMPAAKPSEPAIFPGGEKRNPLRPPEVATFPGNPQNTQTISQIGNVGEPLPPGVRPKDTFRYFVIVALAIVAVGLMAWLLSGRHSEVDVKAGDCGIANNGTASGNTINCGPPPPAAPPTTSRKP